MAGINGLGNKDNYNMSLYGKIASGNKLQKAADGAADMAIAQKMETQIRTQEQLAQNAAMDQAYQNIKDSGLSGMVDYAQSISELSIRQMNGTMSADDKLAIQNQIDQYSAGMSDITNQTKYNESYVLKGYNPTGSPSDMIGQITSTRSDVGAKTNGIEHSLRANQISTENTTAAKSRIADTDVAKASMQLKKNQVLRDYQTMMQKRQQDEKKKQAMGIFM
jgi:flagellin